MSAIRAKYYWKELTSDGLLKEPGEAGPYYERVSLNGSGWEPGFETEETAIAHLVKMKSEYEYQFTADYVLVKVYG